MAKNILIVGGQGFIGTHLSQRALQKGLKVTVLSLRNKGFAMKFPDMKTIQVLQADATQAEQLKNILKDQSFHYVINCSGYIDHTPLQKGGRRYIEQHYTSVLNLVECLNRDVLEGFVQIGSSDEYGNQAAPQQEDIREAPISPYSMGKVAATHMLQMLYLTEQFPAAIARIFLTYGPGQNDQRFLPQIIKGCLKDQAFPTSAGEQLRDFCYIDDVVDAIFQMLETPKAHGQILNIASGQGVSIRIMIETVCHLIGKGQPEFGKFPYRPGENMKLYANTQKAQNLLGWIPRTSLEQGLMTTIHFYKQNA